MTVEGIITKIKANEDVRSVRTINGYKCRTVFSHKNKDGEVDINVLVVYDKNNSDNIVQISVDAENRYGALLETEAFSADCTSEEFSDQDFSEIAATVYHWMKM